MKQTRADKMLIAGIKKHGNEALWRQYLRDCANKSDRSTPRGFTVIKENNPELQKKISSLGGLARSKKYK